MSVFEQGERTVFAYSRKVLKILRRKPARVNQFDKILIRYYIEGLGSQRLREMAIMSFQKPDSDETPSKVVKGVMRLAMQLKMKGYKRNGGGDGTESSDEEESSDDNDSDSSSDSDDDKAHRHSRKSGRRSKRSEKRSERKYADKAKKKGRSREDDSIHDEVKELRGMLQELMKSQKSSSSSTGVVTARSEEDIIPLDSYAVNRTYGGYPQQERYEDARFNQGQLGNRQPQYPNRRSQAQQYGNADPTPVMGRGQEQAHMGPTTFETFRNPYQPPRGGNPSAQPIVGPNGVLYYPMRNTLICYHCGEEGHVRPHCPKLRSYVPQSTLPENGRVDAQRREDILPPPTPHPPPSRAFDQAVSVVEIATTSSAFDGVKV
ncbi:hypothetical protein L873DRAFT_79885, partial [Choiromyces venosus 120613-1]